MKTLNPISLPLNSVSLIEASAGTGKTYTITSLYLRLLLQAGDNSFVQALSVEQILLVTFTEAATQELKERIRERIHIAKQGLQDYLKHRDLNCLSKDPFLLELIQRIDDLPLAIQRLTLAEQNLDMAAIYTIHGFCRRMLIKYAFNSGIHFNLELSTQDTPQLERLVRQFWRQHFYPLPLLTASYIKQQLKSPQHVLSILSNQFKCGIPPVKVSQEKRLNQSISQLLTELQYFLQQIQEFKQQWLSQQKDIIESLLVNLKALKGFGEKTVRSRVESVSNWARDQFNFQLNKELVKYLNQQSLNKSAENNPIQLHPIFLEADKICALGDEIACFPKLLQYHYIQQVHQDLLEFKATQPAKGFDDLLRLLNQALYAEQGKELAKLIGYQYPFAMIDEFQDTDALQYQIFAKLYLENSIQPSGFIMIGDPKQAIYQFRGADIFTYLNAAKQVKQRFNLDTNYRSEQKLVAAVNQLFDVKEGSAFLYEGIQFLPVKGNRTDRFYLNRQPQPPIQIYLHENYDEHEIARNCAQSIQRWLQYAEQRQAVFAQQILSEQDYPDNSKSLQNQNIAVLVRNRYEADSIKSALAAVGIASVYLSDRSNVFDCREARELAIILRACLNPLNERNILNAIATAIFALTAAEIQQIKQEEMRWELWVERFVAYQKAWQQQGILAMLHQLFLQENIPQKLMAMEQGERRVTDLLHLAEILQQGALLNESEDSLLRWFERQLQQQEENEELRTRLESEQQLVKIVTIYKSKGLQYDLVWLPFIGKPTKHKNSDFVIFHDSDGQAYWDMEGRFSQFNQQEHLAEEMRLLYVALTRAKYQVTMALPSQFNRVWNPLLYLLSNGELGGDIKVTNSYQARILLDNFTEFAVEDFVEKENAWRPNDNVEELPTAAEFIGKIEQNWRLTSFTQLAHTHQCLLEKQNLYQWESSKIRPQENDSSVLLDVARDYDLGVGENRGEVEAFSLNLQPISLRFPRGSNVGNCFHRYFEHYDFNQVNAEGVKKLCDTLQLDDSWLEPTQNWIQQILLTPLLDNSSLCLAQILPHRCLKEMQFFLKLGNAFQVDSFNQLLHQYHSFKRDFILEQIQGMVRGFIDLVFESDGKFYILDYKTHWLGSEANYESSALSAAIQGADYDLQYLLYCLALHRYLGKRLPNYQYKQHMGGVIYCFVRGMNGENTKTGIFFEKPAVELIEGLDLLFNDKI